MVAQNSTKTVNESWLAWYLICLTLPLSTIYVVGYVRPYEIAVLLIIIPALITPVDSNYRKLTALDMGVILFAAYMLLSVIVGISNIYESARAYRYSVLGPVLMYASIRLLPFSLRIVTRAHALMTVVVLIQTLIVISVYLEEGRRPKGVPHELVGYIVKYGLLTSYILAFNYFIWKTIKSRIIRYLAFLVIIVLAAGLISSASRAVLFPTVIMLLIAAYIWRSKHRRKLMAVGSTTGLCLMVVLIAFSPPKFDYIEEGLIEDKRSLERLISAEEYLMDLTGRFQYWGWIFDETMEHPVFGYGAAAIDLKTTDIGKKKGHNPSHTHNALMSILVMSGLIGLAVFLFLIYRMLYLLVLFRAVPSPREPFEKMLVSWSVVFLVVSLTNGIEGGNMMILFFVLGFMQQVVLHGQYEEIGTDDKTLNDTNNIDTLDKRILMKKSRKPLLGNKADSH